MNTPARKLPLPEFQLHHRLALTIEDERATVDDMASLFECHRNTILNWVSGRSTPRRRDVREWAMRTGVSFEWLWNGTDGGGNSTRQSGPAEYLPAECVTELLLAA